MKNYDFSIILFLALATLVIILIGCYTVRTAVEKLYIIFLLSFNCIYAGLGIASNQADNKYIIPYLLFTLFLFLGLRVGFVLFRKRHMVFDELMKGRGLLNVVGLIYWFLLLLQLVYPVNRLAALLRPSVSLQNIFENQMNRREDNILYLIGIIVLLIKPFYYLFLYKLKGVWKAVILLLLEMYFGIIINGYIGRSGLLANLLTILIIGIIKLNQQKTAAREGAGLFRYKFMLPKFKFGIRSYGEEKRLYYQYIFSIGAIVLLVILNLGLLFDYQNIRLGAESLNISILDKIDALLQIELGFPNHYMKAESMAGQFSPISYFIWFVTLVIPKRILPISDIMLLNYEFSTNLTGISFGMPGFYVLLPSLLGEGILLYGASSFLHAFFIGLVSGGFCSFFKKQKGFACWNIYLLTQIMLMARGGSQGTLAVLVNSSLLVAAVVFYEFIFMRKEG